MSEEVRTHKDLNVWKKAVDFVTDIYRITGGFPKDEIFGLSSQMRRSAISIPSNIAEGAGRHSRKEFIQFLYVALGSLAELETQLIIANNLGMVGDCRCLDDIAFIRKQLLALIRSLKKEKLSPGG